MRCVLIESPFRGDNYAHTKAHEAYLEACIADSLSRGEAPFASHALYPRALNDIDPVQRKQGIEAGLEIGKRLDLTACYIDHGVSAGMFLGVKVAQEAGREIVFRRLFGSTGRPAEAHGLPLDTLLQIPSVKEGLIWFRPLFWKGRGEALEIRGKWVDVVPHSSSDKPPIRFKLVLEDLQQADWEIVAPEEVIKERT